MGVYEDFLATRKSFNEQMAKTGMTTDRYQQLTSSYTPREFSMSGGIQGGNYVPVDQGNWTDQFFLGMKDIGDYWNNLPANLTGNQDLTFDPTKFSEDPLGQLGRFAISLPGMVVGGIPTGIADFGEFITGNPYHDAEKREDGKWYMSDQDLDMSQRAASLGNSIINVGGTFTGGAGRAIGAGGKLLSAGFNVAGATGKAQKISKAFQGLSEGVATRIYNQNLLSKAKKAGTTVDELTKNQGKGKGFAIGLALDSGDEGIEEFTQSYLDDVRYKTMDEDSFDRAVNAGIWGAVGGAMLGAGARGISMGVDSFNEKRFKSKVDKLLDDLEVSDPETREALWATPQHLRATVLSRINSVADARIRDSLQSAESRKAGGSGLGMQIGTDPNLKLREIIVTTDNVESVYWSSEESAEKVAATFGTSKEVLDSIFNVQEGVEPEYHGAVGKTACLNKLLEEAAARGHIAQIALGRNPDTKYGGFYLDIARVEDGSGHLVNPIVMAILGSDFDADKSTLYYDPKNTTNSKNAPQLNVNGYPLDLLIDPESGKSTVDWLYYGLDKWTKLGMGEKNLRQVVSDILSPYKGYKIKVGNGNEEYDITEYFGRTLEDIFKSDDVDIRNDALSRFIVNLAQQVDNAQRAGYGQDAQNGLSAAEELIQSTFGDPENLIQNYQEVLQTQFVSNVATELGTTPEVVESWWSQWQQSGSLGDNTKVFQMTDVLGLLSFALGKDGNPIFRQYGMLLYGAKSRPAFFKDVATIFASMSQTLDKQGSMTAVDRLIRESFRMCVAGEDPQTSIEGIITRYMYAEVVARTNLYSQPINSKERLDEVLKVMREVHAKWADRYNKWGRELTAAGWDENYFSIYKTPLKEDSSPAEIYQVFGTIFGGAKVTDVFDKHAIPAELQELSVNQFIDMLYQNYTPTSVKSVLAGADENMSEILDWIDGLVKAHSNSITRLHGELVKIWKDIDLTNIQARMKANNGALDPNDVPAILKLFDALHLTMGDRVACYLRIFATDEFLNTDLGQLIMNARKPDDFLNICRCASIRAQFQDLVALRFSKKKVTKNSASQNESENNEEQSEQTVEEEVDDEAKQAEAISILQQMQSISLLHHIIAKDLIEGRRVLYDRYTDPALSLEAASTEYSDFATAHAYYNSADLLVDSLRSSNDQFELNSISKRCKESGRALKTFSEVVYERSVAEAEEWCNIARDASEGDVVRWAYDAAEFLECEVNAELGALDVYSALTLDIAYAEKARNTDTALATYLCNQYSHYGGVVSYLSSIMENEHGHIDKDQWLNNRYHIIAAATRKDYRQEVFDPEEGCVYIVTYDSFWEDVYKKSEDKCGPPAVPFQSGQSINKDMMVRLFTAYPQYCGYFSSATINITNASGDVVASVARKTSAGTSLQQHIDRANDANSETANDYKVEKGLRAFRIQLNANSQFKQAVVRALDAAVLSGQIDMPSLVRNYRKISDQMALVLYRQGILYTEGGEFLPSAQEIFDNYALETETNLFRSLQDIVETYAEHLEDEFFAGIEDDIIDDMALTLMSNKIIRYANSSLKLTDSIPTQNLSGQQLPAGRIKDIIDYYRDSIILLAQSSLTEELEPFNQRCQRVVNLNREEQIRIVKEGIKKDPKYKNLSETEIHNLATQTVDKGIAEELNKINKLETKVLFREKDLQSEQALKDRLTYLYRNNPAALAKVDGDVALIFANGQADLSNLPNLKKVVIAAMTKHILSTAPRKLGVYININAMAEMQETVSTLAKITELAVKRTRQLHGNLAFPNDIKLIDDYAKRHGMDATVLPDMDFLDPTKQSVCANLKVSAPASGNPDKVSTNGSMAKKCAGLAHMDTRLSMDHSVARQLTPEQIIAILDKTEVPEIDFIDPIDDNSKILAVGENGKLQAIGSPKFREYVTDLADQKWNGTIDVYLPEDNAHGTRTANMRRASSQRNAGKLRFSEIIGRIIAESMEGLVLKSKKKYRSIDYIIVGDRPKMAGQYRSQIKDFDYKDDFHRAAIRTMFMTFRNNYRKALREEFETGGMSGLHFGDDQALILAQGLTPGVRVELVATRTDPETNITKSVRYYEVIDASCFVGPDARQKAMFEARMEQIMQADPDVTLELVGFEPMTVSPQEVSNRITRKVNQAYADNDGKPSKKVEMEAARNAMEDWSDYGSVYHADNLGNLLGSVPHISYARHGQFILPDSPTRYQGFYHNFFSGGVADTVRQNSYEAIDYTQPNCPDQGAHNFMHRISSEKNPVLPKLITISFLPSKEDFDSKYPDTEFNGGYQQLYLNTEKVSNLSNKEVQEAGGYGLLMDGEQASAAVTWAKGASKPLIMPASIYRKMFKVYGKKALIDIIHMPDIDEDFYIVDTNAGYQWANPARRAIQASSESRPRNMIRLTAIVDSKHKILGDASAVILDSGRLKDDVFIDKGNTSIKLDTMFTPNNASTKFITVPDAIKLLPQLAQYDPARGWIPKESDAWKKFNLDQVAKANKTHVGKNQAGHSDLKHRVVNYLADLANDAQRMEKAVSPTHIRSGCVLRIAVSGGRYAPVISPDLPSDVTWARCTFNHSTNSIDIDWFGFTSVAQKDKAGATKMDLVDDNGVGENGKFMAILRNVGDDFAPKVGGLIPIDMLVGSDTQLNRTYEMDDSQIKSQLYHTMLLPEVMGSFVFKISEDGKTVSFNDYIESHPSEWTSEDKKKLLSPEWRDVVKEIANGHKHLVDPNNNSEADEIISDICRTYVLQHNGSFFDIFSSYRCEYRGNELKIVVNEIENPDEVFYAQFMLAYHGLERDDMLKLFHVMNHQLRVDNKMHPICPNGEQDPVDTYLFDKNGWMLVSGGEALHFSKHNAAAGDQKAKKTNEWREKQNKAREIAGQEPKMEMVRVPVRLSFVSVLNESTYDKTPTMGGVISPQHMYMRGLDNGYLYSDLAYARAYEASLYGDVDQALRIFDRQYRQRHNEATYHTTEEGLARLLTYNTGSAKEVKHRKEVSELARRINEDRRRLKEHMGENADYLSYDEQHTAVKSVLDKFKSDLHIDISYQELDVLIRYLTGTTPVTNEFGVWEVDFDKWREQALEIIDNLKKYGIPVKIKHDSSSRTDKRMEIPLISPDLTNTLWESDVVRSHHEKDGREDKDAFIQAMKDEHKQAAKNIQARFTDSESSKKERMQHRALNNFLEAASMLWGETSGVFSWGGIPFKEIQKSENIIAKTFARAEQWESASQQIFADLCEMSDKHFDELRKGFERRGYKEFTRTGTAAGDIDAYRKISDAKIMAQILSDFTDISRVMALWNPLVTVANLVDRSVHQSITDLSIHMAHIPGIGRFNPNYSEHWMDQNVVKKSVNNEIGLRLWQSYRMMEFTSDEMAFIAENQGGNIESLIEWLDEREKRLESEGSKFHQAVGKISQWTYEKSTGGAVSIKRQMKNFLNLFVVFAEANGETFWFEPAGEGLTVGEGPNARPMTKLEEMLSEQDGFAKFFNYVILGRDGNPSYKTAMKAMNAAKAGDLAQRHALAMLIKYICSKIPGGLGTFLLHTSVSRFPDYAINKTERVLNYILPMSSIRYIFTSAIAGTKLGAELGIEETQIHAGLKQAVLNDIIHLGMFNVALILFATAGAVEPPDDEALWGNISEWKILGLHANPPWWLEDALGYALPLVCFWKSAALGKPRPDILMNGLSNYLYNNPLVKIEALAEKLVDPYGYFMQSVEEEQDRYGSVAGGAPTADEAGAIMLRSDCLNYLSQFFTPSIIRDIARSDAMDREKDYKHRYDENGEKVAVTYDDATLRYATRKNPVLAFLVGMAKGGDWSYFGSAMPDTEYYDDFQYEAMHQLSVKGLEGDARISRINDIITTLESYDDMEELAATGFFLDNETLQAVASQIWDNYHSWDEYYYTLQAEGKLDYYVAGDGDFTLGQERVGALKLEKDNWQRHWYSLYYDKLRDKHISGTIRKYTRHNTKYAQDVYGNWYNTGQATNMFGFTSYYDNTPSVVTGKLLADENGNPIRALIPENTEIRDLGKLEDWSANGDGKSYSKQYNSIYGGSSNVQSSPSNETLDTSKNTTGTSRGSGGGSGYSRSSGGSSGGGSSYIYNGNPGNYVTPHSVYNEPYPTRISSLGSLGYPTSPSRIMQTSRPQQAGDVAYLRPNFETKGSREANKRGDI